MRQTVFSPQLNRFVTFATICLIVASLYFAQEVLEPLALAILFSFLLSPLVARLEQGGVPRVPACLVVVAGALFLLGSLVWSVTSHAVDLAKELPRYRDNIINKLSHTPLLHGSALSQIKDTLNDFSNQVASTTSQSTTQPVPVVISQQSSGLLYVVHNFLNLMAAPAGMVFVVVIFVIFMLLRREDVRDRFIRLVGEGRLDITTEALAEAGDRISRYLLMQSLVNTAYGLAIGTGLWLIGRFSGQGGAFPNAPLWGLLCGLLRFVPYLGPWMGAICPVLLSIAVYPGSTQLLATACLFVGVEVVNNSAVEPMLYGSSTGLSALAILAAALFWTWLWGPIGLLLSTPLTACIVVIGKYVPQMEFLDVLLGDEPALSPGTRLYQRLLALDLPEATSLTMTASREMPLEALYDTVFIPALAKAERDANHERIDQKRLDAIRQGVREMIERTFAAEKENLSRQAAAIAESTAKGNAPAVAGDSAPLIRARLPLDCKINVLCLPANDEGDELCGLMLSKLLELRGYCGGLMSQASLASEMVDAVEQQAANVVVISALPPGAVNHAMYLSKRIRARQKTVPVVTGLWTFKSDLKQMRERIDASSDSSYAADLKTAIEQIHQFAQHSIVKNAAT